MDTEKSLKNNVARLERAGSEYSRWIEKLRKAVDGLALFLDKTYDSLGGAVIQLPGSFTFQSWSTHEYKLTKYLSSHDGTIEIYFEQFQKSREPLLKFAGVVANGWLNEVAEHIEKHTAKFQQAAESIDRLTAK